MKQPAIIGLISMFVWLCGMPAIAHDCPHHNHDYGNCWDCGRHGYGASANRPLQTVEGKIEEVVYLPGATADSGMVELRIQSEGQTKLIRLAPAGFLKQSGLHLREGDSVTAKGYAVAGMDGDLMVATEIRQGGTTLSLRNAQGRPAW